MKSSRLDNLADGIFAIVMTLLVLEIRVPEIVGPANSLNVWGALLLIKPLFFSYFLSFALLFTYWRAHHYFTSVFAKNIDVHLTNINALFLGLVALIPFSSQLLGTYSNARIAIAIYGLHIILLGLTLWWMRDYIIKSEKIENRHISDRDYRHSTIRLVVPIICSVVAILISFYDTTLSLALYTFAIIFNLLPQSTSLLSKLWLARD
ncbi:DUF1211 domain-containing protein [Candidatus Nomurabacteria bacterium]|nr:DUF1211 domain-containing protein [Candidatus Nomurabacteria bacterium]